jgi:hypothetical protein
MPVWDVPACRTPAGAPDLVPDSPKMSWGALMKQKKAEKEQGIARMIRIKHAVLVIQVGSAVTHYCAWTVDCYVHQLHCGINHQACDQGYEIAHMAARHHDVAHVALLCADVVSGSAVC